MKKKHISDSVFVKSYIQGDEKSLEILIKRHKQRIYNFIYSKVYDRDLTEDIFQDTFIKVIRTLKLGNYNEEGKFQPWMMRIAHNLSIDHFRKEKKHPKITLNNGNDIFNSLTFSENNSESHQENKESKKLLQQLIKELPKKQKEVLVMRHFMEMSFQDIAESTNVSINTALGRMRYALINLRKKLKTKLIAYD